MRNGLLALFSILVAVHLPAFAQPAPERDVRVTDAMGEVSLKTADDPKRPVVVDDEIPLAVGDLIETGPKSQAELTIDGETVIKLQAGSRLKIDKLFVRNTQLLLLQGGVLAKVKPSTGDQGMIFKMPTAVVAIRGTEFAAETANSIAHVCVLDEGQVMVAGVWGREHVKLEPNQETKVTLSAVPTPPHKLIHFQKIRKQMVPLRSRVNYWNKNWKPLSAERRRRIREVLSKPHPKNPRGFRKPEPPQRHKPPATTRKVSSKRRRH